MTEAPEWERCKCSLPSSGHVSMSCQELTEVRHISHFSDALQIIKDHKIKSKFVEDKSKLRGEQIQVVWVSANDWSSPGSIYGTVEFVFNWKRIKNKRKIYWVEYMEQYGIPAYRFLLTGNDMSSSNIIKQYDPKSDQGPVQKINGNWYWNGQNLTSEFMVDSDLDLNDCSKLKFVSHNNQICSKMKGYCSELGKTNHYSSKRVLAYLMGNEITSINHLLMNFSCGSPSLNDSAEGGIAGIYWLLGPNTNFIGGIEEKKQCQKVLSESLSLIGNNQIAESKKIISSLKSKEIFVKTLCEKIKSHFNLPSYRL